MAWRLEKRKDKLILIYKWDLPHLYYPGEHDARNSNLKFRTEGDFKMLEFLLEELVQQSAYTMGQWTITKIQQRLGKIVWDQLGERE